MSTDISVKKGLGRIADCLVLIKATDGLTLGQICSLSSLEPSTIQNWIKRGYVPHPVCKKYYERHLARILLIAMLRESMQIDRVGELLRYINGDADDESDDIISEQALYDLFCEITEVLEQTYPPPDKAKQTVCEIVTRIACDAPQKLMQALEIMALAYLSNLYKREADLLFTRFVRYDDGK